MPALDCPSRAPSSKRMLALDCPSRALELHKGGGPCLPRQSSGAVQGCWPLTAEAGLCKVELNKGAGPCLPRQSSGAPPGCRPKTG